MRRGTDRERKQGYVIIFLFVMFMGAMALNVLTLRIGRAAPATFAVSCPPMHQPDYPPTFLEWL